MSRAGGYKPRPPGTLIGAQAALVTAVGGLCRAADLIGRSKTQVARYTDAAEFQAMPADVIRALERAAETAVVSRFLAAEARCFTVPTALPGGPADIQEAVLDIARQATEICRSHGEALADTASPGIVDAMEARRIIGTVDTAITTLQLLRNSLTEVEGAVRDRDTPDAAPGRPELVAGKDLDPPG